MFDRIIDIGSKVYALTPQELNSRVEEVLTMMIHCDCIDALDEEFRVEAILLSNRVNEIELSKSCIAAKIEKMLQNEDEIV